MVPDFQGKRLEELVQENIGWLRGWFRGRLRNPGAADDLCQDTFLKALRQFPKLRDPDRFSAWLYRIATNVLRDHIRGEARRQKQVQLAGHLEEIEAAQEPRDQGEAEEAEKLLEAIRDLPPTLRDPILLRHSRNLSYREIARILGIRENTVQVRIFRARQMLRKMFMK